MSAKFPLSANFLFRFLSCFALNFHPNLTNESKIMNNGCMNGKLAKSTERKIGQQTLKLVIVFSVSNTT